MKRNSNIWHLGSLHAYPYSSLLLQGSTFPCLRKTAIIRDVVEMMRSDIRTETSDQTPKVNVITLPESLRWVIETQMYRHTIWDAGKDESSFNYFRKLGVKAHCSEVPQVIIMLIMPLARRSRVLFWSYILSMRSNGKLIFDSNFSSCTQLGKSFNDLVNNQTSFILLW